MRNLYKRLGIDVTASEHVIKDAISRCADEGVKADAAKVLLKPLRRRDYDSVHRTLHDIGILRGHLGLTQGEHWRGPVANDYSFKPGNKRSLLQELATKIRSQTGKSAEERTEDTGFGLTAVTWAIFGAIFILLLVSDPSKSLDDHKPGTPQTTRPATKRPEPATLRATPSAPKTSTAQTYRRRNTPQQPLALEDDWLSRVPELSSDFATSPEQSTFSESSLPLPASGTIRWHTQSKGVSPLEIKTSEGGNYFVKLKQERTGAEVLDVFVQGGSTIEIEVPLGNYRLEYVAGEKWYGYKHHFKSSSAHRADKILRFYQSGNQVSGYTITLYKVRDGNLTTSTMPASEF